MRSRTHTLGFTLTFEGTKMIQVLSHSLPKGRVAISGRGAR